MGTFLCTHGTPQPLWLSATFRYSDSHSAASNIVVNEIILRMLAFGFSLPSVRNLTALRDFRFLVCLRRRTSTRKAAESLDIHFIQVSQSRSQMGRPAAPASRVHLGALLMVVEIRDFRPRTGKFAVQSGNFDGRSLGLYVQSVRCWPLLAAKLRE